MVYSFSQIQTYLSCPLKYRYEKIDKLKPDISQESLHLILGTTVHETLEKLYQQISNSQIPKEKETQDILKTIREKELKRVTEINGENYFDKEICLQFYARGEKYIKRYYNKYYPFDQAINMKTEDNIHFSLTQDLKFRGKIDRLDIKDDTMTIVDYKTNKSLPQDSNNTIEDQITLYGLGIAQNYEQQIDKIIGKVIYLHMEREHQREITQEKMESIKEKYIAIMQEIEQKKEQYSKGDNEAFEPTPGYICQNCAFMQICPLYKHQYLEDEEVENNELAPITIKTLIEKYAVIQEKYKNLENEKKLIAQILTDYAQNKNCKKLYSDNYAVSIANKESYGINKTKITEFEEKLKKLGLLDEVQTIDHFKLAKKFKNQDLNYEEYKDFVEKKNTNYISRVSKK